MLTRILGAPCSQPHLVTNIGTVTSAVSALAFVSMVIPGAPLKQLFDFQRVAALVPGAEVTMHFTLPPMVAGVCGERWQSGAAARNPSDCDHW